MKNKNEIEKKKQLKRIFKEKIRNEFENSLPISKEEFKNLFSFINKKLNTHRCDDTFTHTINYLKNNNIKHISEVENWLNNHGAFCDCEVLLNVEEKFSYDAIL